MSVTLNIKNPKDSNVTKLENVPYATTIEKVKRTLIKINKNETDINQVKIVHKGKILTNDQTIGDLQLDGEQEIQLFVTGLKKKVPEVEQPQPAPRGPSIDPIPNPDINRRFNTQPNPNVGQQRQQNPQPNYNQRQNRDDQQQPQLNRFLNKIFNPQNNLKIVFGSIVLIFAITIIMQRISNGPESKTTFLKFSRIAGFLGFFGILLLIIYLQTRDVPWSWPLIKECLLLLVKSLNPNWDANVFRVHARIQ